VAAPASSASDAALILPLLTLWKLSRTLPTSACMRFRAQATQNKGCKLTHVNTFVQGLISGDRFTGHWQSKLGHADYSLNRPRAQNHLYGLIGIYLLLW